MVFESLVSVRQARERPWELFFMGMLYATIALIVGHYIFREDASLVVVFLTTLAGIPLLYNATKKEEEKTIQSETEGERLRYHARVIEFLTLYFVGVVIALTAWFLILPNDVSTQVFAVQLRDIGRIQAYSQAVLGNSIAPAMKGFTAILLNNLRVLLLALFFSLFYGVGALFILTWNASVFAAAVGSFIRTSIGGTMLVAFPVGFLRYAIHGIPEMAAYFIAGLAGGILSIAVTRHEFEKEKVVRIIQDTSSLVAVAVGLLIISAAIEVFITPLLFF